MSKYLHLLISLYIFLQHYPYNGQKQFFFTEYSELEVGFLNLNKIIEKQLEQICSSTDLLVKYKFTPEELKMSFLNKESLISIFCLFKLAIENEKILGKKNSKNTISKGNKKLPMQEYRIYTGPLFFLTGALYSFKLGLIQTIT